MMSFLNRNTGESTPLSVKTFLPMIGKLLSLLVILTALPVSYVLAEEDEFQIDGEWWVSDLQFSYSAEKDENGNYTIYDKNGPAATINADGTVNEGTDGITTTKLQITDHDVLFYVLGDNNALLGELLLKKDEENQYKCIEVIGKMVICFDGQIIPFNSDKVYRYIVSDHHLYIPLENSYVRGDITPLGENAFICTFFSETSSESGRPVVFIRTSMTD